MDVLKELNIEKDIVQVLQTRRLTYFGHVNRIQSERFPRVLLHGYTHGRRPKGRPKKKWIDNIRVYTALTWTFHYMRLPVSLRTGRPGGTLFSVWAANARCHYHRRNGNK